MAETITLLGKRVESRHASFWKVRCGFVEAGVAGYDKHHYTATLYSVSCDGDTECLYVPALEGVSYPTPQAAADAIEQALRELVNGEWREELEYLEGLREK